MDILNLMLHLEIEEFKFCLDIFRKAFIASLFFKFLPH
jgi:hypothetical protein